jgi:hypothetical protein
LIRGGQAALDTATIVVTLTTFMVENVQLTEEEYRSFMRK